MLDSAIPTPSDGARLALDLVGLRREIDRLELRFSQAAAAFAGTGYWDEEGSNSALDWIRINCRVTSNAAADRLSVGRRVADLDRSVEAMHAGEIGFAHVTVMARTAEAVGEAFDEGRLLQLARDNSPGKFHYKCLHYRHAVDAKAYADGQERLAEERSLRLSTAEDGCLLIGGLLDPVGGAAVRTALEPLAQLSGAHDDRNREQRYADALVELASGGKPARVLLDQDSVTIDVGRSKRVVAGPLRRALNARDGQCRWPGCERPASWCDGHHMVHWIDGGDTDLDNLVLLCRRHHRMVHEGGWQLVKTNDGRIVTVGPMVHFGVTPSHSWRGDAADGGEAGPD